ncbi:MAG: ABC-type glycerol-3-phosphate transport system, permease component [Chloroflexi bacterium AL-W]|nr:ABC-type glycerol-3-phosphate transport system, permease component [Chloroflexi bacterium AL-N1]NOK65923.1 ABC-type glycerol-3-phosphate transport system, permease component [Chloroflexi bacterium AL-N10]NOK72804.1 ABC-type glycerol-3-phosphate transport system, permease component [Chloroflexi bacterium AL-N5]NOK79701.1 ABC-type glycerol-3-phosphate transport system, permease component [Chloroflexi bacterium AL-W]NOK93026.1 ABC-type glycerol-3-phosphate transport system, permease component [
MQATSVKTTPQTSSSSYRVKHLISRVTLYAMLIGFSILFLVPFLWLLSTSFKQESQAFAWPPTWIPNPFWPQNYVQMFELVPMTTYLINTVKIVALNATGAVLTASLVGYGFARLRAPGLNVLFAICLATLMLPHYITVIPLFMLYSRFGWVDTHIPLWITAWFGGGAWNIFLFRQFFSAIPRELEEAAMMDGASRFGCFWRIVLPNAKAPMAVVAVFAIQWNWTDIFHPVIFLNSRENFTLALGLTNLLGSRVTYVGPLMAASVLMTLPMVLMYFFAQRYITEGIVTSGIK